MTGTVFDLSELDQLHEFDFLSETLGLLRCHALTLSAPEKVLADQGLNGSSFVLKLIEHVAEHPSAGGIGEDDAEPKGAPVSAAEAALLSDDEIEAFARKYLAHNPSLLESSEGENRKVRTDDEGNREIGRASGRERVCQYV